MVHVSNTYVYILHYFCCFYDQGVESRLWIRSRPLREYQKSQGHNHQIRNVVHSADWNHRIRPFNFYREVVELYDKIVIFFRESNHDFDDFG
jgi:hypothetical protein